MSAVTGHAPRFSVVIPCYRIEHRAWLVRDALRSVAAQTFGEFEVLLVNDGSPDATEEVLNRLVLEEPCLAHRARVLNLAENGGVCAARNAGIAAARGDYIAFLDFDDIWHPSYLERVADTQKETGLDDVVLVRTDFIRIRKGEVLGFSTGSLAFLNELPQVDFNAWHLLNNFPVAMGSAIVVKRALYATGAIPEFDMWLTRRTAEDILFGFQLLERGIRPYYVDEPLCFHRRFAELESRGTAASLRGDELEVQEFIRIKAAAALEASVLRQEPHYEKALGAVAKRLATDFTVKRHFLKREWMPILNLAVTDPRALRTLLRLVSTTAIMKTPLGPFLAGYQFRRGPQDTEVAKRYRKLRSELGLPTDPTIAI